MSESRRICALCLVLAMALLVGALPLGAIVEPDRPLALAEKQFRHPDLQIDNVYLAVSDLAPAVAAQASRELAALGVPATGAYLDIRGGLWGTLFPAQPLIPGGGVGNELSWAVAPQSDAALGQAAWEAFVAYLEQHSSVLQIDRSELRSPGNVTVHNIGALVQIN